MPKQFIWIIATVVVVLGLGVALFIAQPKDQGHSSMKEASGVTLNLSLDPLNYDFGTISMFYT